MLFSIFLLSLGVICEYHFGIYQRVQRIVGYLWKQITTFFLWIGQLLARFFKWLGEWLGIIVEMFLWFVLWLATLFPWWLWAILFALLALITWLILGIYLLAALLAVIFLMVCLLGGLWRVIIGLLTVLALSIPNCSSPPAVSVQQKQEEKIVVVTPPMIETPKSLIVLVQPGDGTIRATARGGYPLGLNESITWTKGQGLVVRKVHGFVHAPTLYLGDTLEYKDGQWILHRPGK